MKSTDCRVMISAIADLRHAFVPRSQLVRLQGKSGNYRIPNARLPRNLAKTRVSLQRLAKVVGEGKITLNPEDNRLFGVS